MNTSWNGQRNSYPRKMRAAILHRDPVCQCPSCPNCGPNGCTNPSTEADHKTSHAECIRAGTNPDTIDNGQGLCAACHKHKTQQEQQRGKARLRGRRPARPHPAQTQGEAPPPPANGLRKA